jgi:hypothetical protein
MKSLAPTLVTTYNRFEHFRKSIESLSSNQLAKDTHLFIAIDAPYQEMDVKSNAKVISIAKEIKGFGEKTLLIRDNNFGFHNNYHSAINEILNVYEKFIFFEDDNIFTADFLEFINKGLEAYKERDDILSICGYNYPVKMPYGYDKDVYLWKGMSAWGFGTWKNKWNLIEWEEKKAVDNVRKFLKNPTDAFKLSKIANHYLPALLNMDFQEKLHGDGYICMNQYLNDMYSVFPIETKVKNIGHDGSGLNCKVRNDDVFANQKLPDKPSKVEFPEDLKENKGINETLAKFFKKSVPKNVAFSILLGLHNVGLKSTSHSIIKRYYDLNK